MIQTILVPVDRSDLSEHAVPYAVGIARAAGARLELALVHRPPEEPQYGSSRLEEKLREHEHAYLQGLREMLETGFGVRSSSVMLEGPVAAALCQHVRTIGADLVVMSTHGRGGLQRVRLGSVADSVLRRSPAPVLLVRPPEARADAFQARSFHHILLPLDGSPLSDQALPLTASLASLTGARLTLLTVIEAEGGAAQARRVPGWLEAKAHLNGLLALPRLSSVRVETRVVGHPHPSQGIVQEAEAAGVDLISMATRGRGGLSRMLLGSVAESVLHSTTIPVLLHTEQALRQRVPVADQALVT